jgi:hypothetical protein
MRHAAPLPALLLATLAAAAPAAAQTCAGALDVPLVVPVGAPEDARQAPVPPSAMWRVEGALVTRRGEEFHDEPRPPLPFDSLAAHPERFAVHRARMDLHGVFVPAETLSVRTRCGFQLLRLVITRENGGPPLTVDFYNVPPHLPLRLDAPLLVRPGHLRADLGGSPGLDRMARGPSPYRLIPHGWLRPAE